MAVTNPYYEFDPAFIPGTKARSEDVNVQYQNIQNAFDLLPGSSDAITTGTATFGVESGSGNAYVVTMPDTRTTEQDGDEVVFFSTHANTGAATLNVDGLGAKAIVNHEGNALVADDILNGIAYIVRYDATNTRYQMVSPSAAYQTSTAASAAAALGSETAAAASAVEAMQWAVHPEDDDVDSAPGQFSAFHWAQKALGAASTQRIVGDITTASPPTTEAVTGLLEYYDADETDLLAHVGFNGSNAFVVSNKMHGGVVQLIAEDASGVPVTLLEANPVTPAVILADGVALHMSSPNGLDSMVMNLDDLDANMTFAGTVTDLNITVQNGIRLNDESTWSTNGNDTYLRGDGQLNLGYGGSNVSISMSPGSGVQIANAGVDVMRTFSRASGGASIYNDYSQRDTGTFERILSQSDVEAGQFKLHFGFNTNIAASDPGTGHFKFDASPMSGATNMYINDLSDGELDAARVINQLASGDILRIASIQDETLYFIATIGTPVDNTGWWTIPITSVLSSSGTNFSNHQCVIDVQWNSTASGVPDGSADGQLLAWDQTTDQEWKVAANISWDGSQLLLPLENDALTPTLAFGDGDTGFYELSDDTLRLSIGGVTRFQFFVNATNPQITGTNSASFHCTNVSTSRTVATIGPRRSINTGIGSGSADEMSLIAGGVEILRIEETSTNDHIKALFPIYHLERAAAQPDIAAYGQFWVRNDVPNTPMFTDDTGVDHVLNVAGLDATGAETISGDWVFTNNTGVTGTESALRQDFLYIDGKEAIDGNDAFLRLNQNGDFASGVYTSGAVRIDNSVDFRDSTGARTMVMSVDINDLNFSGGSNVRNIEWHSFTGAFQIRTGIDLELYSAGDADDVVFNMDGTDLNMTFGGVGATTDWNVTGLTGSMRVAANVQLSNITGPAMLNEAASATNPTLVPNRADVNTGIGSNAGEQVSIICNGVEIARFVDSGTNEYLEVRGTMFITEQADAHTDISGDGQLWVRNYAPNQLWFTDDTGDDYPVAIARTKVRTNTSSNMTTDSIARDLINGLCMFNDGSAYTITLEPSTDTQFPIESSFQIINGDPTSPGTITINEGSGGLLYYIEPDGTVTDTAGGCTMSSGVATVWRQSASTWFIWGSGITA